MKIEQVRKMKDPINRLLYWIRTREEIRSKKEAGEARPYSDDEIFNTYRFCNVHREDDKVTKWIAANWREPNSTVPHLWFAMVIARLLNLPSSLEVLKLPVPWNPTRFLKILNQQKEKELKVFNGAYIVSTNGHAMDKLQYLTERVLNPLWQARNEIKPTTEDTLLSFHARLIQFDGLGSFMAAQVVADMKYVEPLLSTSDWKTFAASGPGSKRGLNRLHSRDPDASWPKRTWNEALTELHEKVLIHHDIHAQDLQNCLCEHDKYERALWGEGTPKQLYR